MSTTAGASDRATRRHKSADARNSPLPRLSLEDSREFARLLHGLMDECRLPSVYSLFLHVNFPRATLHRWLSGRARIPITAARDLLDELGQHAAKWHRSEAIQQLDYLIRAEAPEHSNAARLRAELRARGLPVARTIEALRAANLLPLDEDRVAQEPACLQDAVKNRE